MSQQCESRRGVVTLFATLAALALLGAACSASASRRHSTGTPATGLGGPPAASKLLSGAPTVPLRLHRLTWHECGAFLCSRLAVPVSYFAPTDGTIELAVVELAAARDPGSARDLVINPGGPGESGVQFLKDAVFALPASLRARFNLVSFDPRGVGGSDPVGCTNSAGLRRWIALDPSPITRRQVVAVIARIKAFDRSCGSHLPREVLANLSTATTALDMDRLRGALGEAKLDYLGFSYGTYLGALYAQAFPSHVGNMVLDGAFDPALSSAALDMAQAESFERDLHDFFAWCPSDAACKNDLPRGARVTYREVMRGLQSGGSLTAHMNAALGGTQQVDYAVVLTGVISSLYTTTYWSYLAEGLAQAAAGNGSVLTGLAYSYAGLNANGTASNLVPANLAISCLDRPVPRVASYPGLARELARTAPDFGPAEAWSGLACDFWPVSPTGRAAAVHLSRPLPILVVGSTHDPATPYAWAEALTSQLAGSRLLTRTGDGHTGYFSSTCVQHWVDSYLSTGARPPAGTVCPSNT